MAEFSQRVPESRNPRNRDFGSEKDHKGRNSHYFFFEIDFRFHICIFSLETTTLVLDKYQFFLVQQQISIFKWCVLLLKCSRAFFLLSFSSLLRYVPLSPLLLQKLSIYLSLFFYYFLHFIST